MTDKNLDFEEKIKEVANEYSQKGYTVFTNPQLGNDTPEFLRNYSPDIIAISENDKVVIEVRNKYSLSQSKELENLASVIDHQKGWRFELIVINSKK
ncbi:hypothetical protein DRW41_05445 [Neobacillus piezotolerans]|uniref:REase AHJR-like domain-containing protein n=1 Tax=Neobacillus piezotolerans TaxID=2259171 RepID=A0A3D8GS74_9BACI|nr:hypothetical protein [Neobacillus piezotolerans]RDU37298.1 hypothetical protein DRW41_05445 [Neobacillus piezotolerans]